MKTIRVPALCVFTLMVCGALAGSPADDVAQAKWVARFTVAQSGPHVAGEDISAWAGVVNGGQSDAIVCVLQTYFSLEDGNGENIAGNPPPGSSTHQCTTDAEKHLVARGETYYFHTRIWTSKRMSGSASLHVWITLQVECPPEADACEPGRIKAELDTKVALNPASH